MLKSKPKILYTSKDVRSAVANIFKDAKVRRVAISAFIGQGAKAFLQSPQGIRIICSPTPGATNPNELRDLLSLGATVEFVKSLHMKVYWAEGRGAVITSANLSTNAMGKGGLLEAGVLLDSGSVDIDRMVGQLGAKVVTESELKKLDVQHRNFYKRVGWKLSGQQSRTYGDWLDSPYPEPWSLFVYDKEYPSLSETATRKIAEIHNTEPHDGIWANGPWAADSWILCAKIIPSKKSLPLVSWFYVDRVVHVPKTDANFHAQYPYELIQVRADKHYTLPPFKIDAKLRKALFEFHSQTPLKVTGYPSVLKKKERGRLAQFYRSDGVSED